MSLVRFEVYRDMDICCSSVFAWLTLLFLFLPGFVSCVVVLVLRWYGHKELGRMNLAKVVAIAAGLLFFYPVVPTAL